MNVFKRVRIAGNLTQNQMISVLGVGARSTVCNYESGYRFPNKKALGAYFLMADKLGIKISEFKFQKDKEFVE
jgi:transcriptional regulator with XRE-family HTH domain